MNNTINPAAKLEQLVKKNASVHIATCKVIREIVTNHPGQSVMINPENEIQIRKEAERHTKHEKIVQVKLDSFKNIVVVTEKDFSIIDSAEYSTDDTIKILQAIIESM
jgi:quinolinate synthase